MNGPGNDSDDTPLRTRRLQAPGAMALALVVVQRHRPDVLGPATSLWTQLRQGSLLLAHVFMDIRDGGTVVTIQRIARDEQPVRIRSAIALPAPPSLIPVGDATVRRMTGHAPRSMNIGRPPRSRAGADAAEGRP